MRESWLTPEWRGRRRIAHPINWARLPEFDVGVALIQTKAPHGHENRWHLYVRRFNEADVASQLVMAQTVITSSPGTTQTITSDATWNNADNRVEVIGAGARGAIGASTSTSGGGAGGGAYSRIVNASITTPGTTQFFARVGGITATNGTAGGDSWWTLTSPGTAFPVSGTAVGAKGGAALASATSATGGAGGASASAYTSPATASIKFSGGAGGNAGAAATSGGGGGGAGGEDANGVIGGAGPGAGGAGNGGTVNLGGAGGPAGNGAPALGGAGTNLDGVIGSGGGGGGGNSSGSTGGQGGLYGGGGGGGGRSNGTGGQGRQGVVVLTWTPATTITTTTGEADAVALADGESALVLESAGDAESVATATAEGSSYQVTSVDGDAEGVATATATGAFLQIQGGAGDAEATALALATGFMYYPYVEVAGTASATAFAQAVGGGVLQLRVYSHVLDNGFAALDTQADKIFVCSTEPVTYAEASSTYAVGVKNFGVGNVFAAPIAGTPGRIVVSTAITDGSVITPNTQPVCWAVVDSVNSRLLVTGPAIGFIGMQAGGSWTLEAISIHLPG